MTSRQQSLVVNRQWIYAKRPESALGPEHFALQQNPVPQPGPGQALVRVRAVSIDPAQRAWMMMATYRPMIQPGKVMPAFAIGEVVESNAPTLNIGDFVDGDLCWQDYAIVDPTQVRRRDRARQIEHLIGVFSITGLTAYFGLLEVGRPRPGETVVVSGAAGAVGCIVVQLARIAGCRTVGVAGGAEKCQWLREELGVDAVVDYKAGDLRAALKNACPNGIDLYFDNTGGDILEAALILMNEGGRVACCGAVASYDRSSRSVAGPRGIPGMLVAKRIRMEGFIVLDYEKHFDAAEARLLHWMKIGALKAPVDVAKGLERAPQALIDLLDGRNRGKSLVLVS